MHPTDFAMLAYDALVVALENITRRLSMPDATEVRSVPILEREPATFGDVVVHCGHLDMGLHWFQPKTPIKFSVTDGESVDTVGWADWLCCCEQCFDSRGILHVTMHGDGVWGIDLGPSD